MRIPASVARRTLQASTRAGEILETRFSWLVLSILIGVLPTWLCYQTGLAGIYLAPALLLTPLLIASVARDNMLMGFGSLGAAFLSHSAAVMVMAANNPDQLAVILPQGAEYWKQSLLWIETGIAPSYELKNWIPAHLRLLGAVGFFSYVSLGFVT
ncbi:MAG: hypothetical protein N2C14_30850, partial [Planctomycetales bacterium]